VQFNETIDPAKLAFSLLEVGAQLSTEMRYDLHNIEKENDRLRLKYKHKHVFRKTNMTKTGSDSDVVDGVEDVCGWGGGCCGWGGGCYG
jgi:hypothetical protein